MLNICKRSSSNLRKMCADGGNLMLAFRLRNNFHFIKFLSNQFFTATSYQSLKRESKETLLHIFSNFCTPSCCSLIVHLVWCFKLVSSIATKKTCKKFLLFSDQMTVIQIVVAASAKLASFQVSAACPVVLILFYTWCCPACFSLIIA